MAVTFRASSNASTGGAAAQNLAVGKPAGSTTADVLLARIAVYGGTNVRVLAPTGWALVRRIDNGTALSLFIYSKNGSSGDPATWTWVFDSARAAVGEITTYYNNTANHYVRLCAESSQANASGTSHSVQLPAQNVANSEIVTAWALQTSSSWTPPSGETEREDTFTGSGSDVTLSAADVFSASTAAAGTISATSGAAGVSCAWCGILSPDGVYQPSGPGTTVFVYDDAFAAGGASVGFTDADLLLGFPNEFEELIGRNTGLQFSTAVRKFFQENAVFTLGGQGSDGNNQTTLTLLSSSLALRSAFTYRNGGGPIRTNFGTKRGDPPAALKPSTMGGVDGVDIVGAGSITIRGELYAYGGTIRTSGVLSILPAGNAVDSEIAGNLFSGGNNSIYGDSSSVGRHYNNIYSGKGTVNVLAGYSVAESDGCLILGGSPSALFSSNSFSVGKLSRLRFGGTPTLADVSLGNAGDLSGILFLSPTWSGHATPVRLSGTHAAAAGPKLYRQINTKLCSGAGVPLADIPVRLVSDIDGLVIDTKTFSDGDLGFLSGGIQNGVWVADYYRDAAGNQLRRDRKFTLKFNQPGGAYPVNPAYGSGETVFGWPGATSGDFQDAIVPFSLPPPNVVVLSTYYADSDIDVELREFGEDVIVAGVSAKGIVERKTIMVVVGETPALALEISVTVRTNSLPALAIGVDLTLGGVVYKVRDVRQKGDGALSVALLANE